MLETVKEILRKTEAHKWLKVDKEAWSAEALGEPSLAEVNPPVEIQLVFEFYSR